MDSPDINMGLWSLLLLLGALHGWFLCLVLFLYLRRSQIILGALIFIFSYSLFSSFLWQSGWISMFPHLVATDMPLLFLIGPLYFWFFSRNLTRNRSINWIHFTPAILCLATIIPFYMGSHGVKLDYIESKDPSLVQLPATRAIYFGLLFLQLAYYWILSGRLLQIKTKVRDGRKNKGVRSISNWLRGFHYAFGLFLTVFLGTYLVLTVTPWNYNEIRYASQFSLALLVHAVAYLTLKQSIFRGLPSATNELVAKNRAELKQKILERMSLDKPFLKRDLTLSEFAKDLSLSPTTVSTIINQEFQSNFSEFINSYRVKEAVRLLQDKRYNHFKVEAIGHEVGFKNKVSFNRVIKKHYGKTPSQLRFP